MARIKHGIVIGAESIIPITTETGTILFKMVYNYEIYDGTIAQITLVVESPFDSSINICSEMEHTYLTDLPDVRILSKSDPKIIYRPAPKEMTIEEIEKRLGHEIKIISHREDK